MGIIVAVMFAALVVAGGVALDFTRAAQVKSMLQGLVDAAATSGATAYVSSVAASTAATIATNYMNNGIASLHPTAVSPSPCRPARPGRTAGPRAILSPSPPAPHHRPRCLACRTVAADLLSGDGDQSDRDRHRRFRQFHQHRLRRQHHLLVRRARRQQHALESRAHEVYTNTNNGGAGPHPSRPPPVRNRLCDAERHRPKLRLRAQFIRRSAGKHPLLLFASQPAEYERLPASHAELQSPGRDGERGRQQCGDAGRAVNGTCLSATPPNAAPNCAMIGNQTFGLLLERHGRHERRLSLQ